MSILSNMEYFSIYSTFINEDTNNREQRKLNKIARKSKRYNILKHKKNALIKKGKSNKAIRKYNDKIDKLNRQIDDVVTKYNKKNYSQKLFLKKLYEIRTLTKEERWHAKKSKDAVRIRQSIDDVKTLNKLIKAVENDFDRNVIAALMGDMQNQVLSDKIFKADEDARKIGKITDEDKNKSINVGKTAALSKTNVKRAKKGLEPIKDDENPSSVDGSADGTTLTYTELSNIFKNLEQSISSKRVPKLSINLKNTRYAEVQVLQKILKSFKYYSKISNLKEVVSFIKTEPNIDGYFGNKTKEAVKLFQQDNSLNVSGIVDIKTWSVIFKYLDATLDDSATLYNIARPTVQTPIKNQTESKPTPKPKPKTSAPIKQHASSEIKKISNSLVTQKMWSSTSYTNESDVYNLFVTNLRNKTLNKTNLDALLSSYNSIYTAYKDRKSYTWASGQSKGLISDLIFAFDTSPKDVNKNAAVHNDIFEKYPHQNWKFENFKPNSIISTDTKSVYALFMYMALLGNSTFNSQLAKTGINVSEMINVSQKLKNKILTN